MWKYWKLTAPFPAQPERRGGTGVDRPVLHRVDRRAVAGRDVDALVEREDAVAAERVVQDAAVVDRAGVAEEAPDRVLPVERLERPRVRARRPRREQGEEGDDGCNPEATHGEDPQYATQKGRAG